MTDTNEYKQNSLAIANYFIEISDHKVTPLQLVKLVFLTYGWGLAFFQKRLFEERIEAWKFGPVIPSVYHTFKHYQRNNITEQSTELKFDDNNQFITCHIPIIGKHKEKIESLIREVWEVHKEYNAYELIDMTHVEGSPWKKVYKDHERHTQLQDEDIQNYYTKLMNEQ